jgi:hypothetical protein
LSTGFAHPFYFGVLPFSGNVLLPTHGIPEFGKKNACQLGIDKMRFSDYSTAKNTLIDVPPNVAFLVTTTTTTATPNNTIDLSTCCSWP